MGNTSSFACPAATGETYCFALDAAQLQNHADRSAHVRLKAGDSMIIAARSTSTFDVIQNISRPTDGSLRSFVVRATVPQAIPFIPLGSVATGWWSAMEYHTPSIALGLVNEAIFQLHTQANNTTIKRRNCPLPRTSKDLQMASWTSEIGTSLTLGFFVIVGMSFLAASFLFFPVEEAACHAKHVQLVSGCDIHTYWIASFTWDIVNMSIPYALHIALFAIFEIKAFQGEGLGLVVQMHRIPQLPFTFVCESFSAHPASATTVRAASVRDSACLCCPLEGMSHSCFCPRCRHSYHRNTVRRSCSSDLPWRTSCPLYFRW